MSIGNDPITIFTSNTYGVQGTYYTGVISANIRWFWLTVFRMQDIGHPMKIKVQDAEEAARSKEFYQIPNPCGNWCHCGLYFIQINIMCTWSSLPCLPCPFQVHKANLKLSVKYLLDAFGLCFNVFWVFFAVGWGVKAICLPPQSTNKLYVNCDYMFFNVLPKSLAKIPRISRILILCGK